MAGLGFIGNYGYAYPNFYRGRAVNSYFQNFGMQNSLQEQSKPQLMWSKPRSLLPEDHLIDSSIVDKLLTKLRVTFVTTPKTVLKGLRGDDSFNFSDKMLVAKVPYYLGGLFLTLGFLLGGNKKEGVRQAVAVVSYLVGVAATHGVVNALYQSRYGIDLGMLYRSKEGQVEQVFASADFPRFDLLTAKHYAHMAQKMEIPENLSDPDGYIREQVRHAIVRSRAIKLIMGTFISAIGAGYLARSNAWTNLCAISPTVKNIIKDSRLKWFQKCSKVLATSLESLSYPLQQQLSLHKKVFSQRALLWGGLALALGAVGTVWFKGVPNRIFNEPYKKNGETSNRESQSDSFRFAGGVR